jgi:hypothetical protein
MRTQQKTVESCQGKVQLGEMTPQKQQAHEQLVELAMVLAVGLQRLYERKSSQFSPVQSENPLDCGVMSGGHACRKAQDRTTP